MEVIESQIRQIYASIVWTHKIQEKQADMYKNVYAFIEFLRIVCVTLTTSGIVAVLFINEDKIKIATAIISFINLLIEGINKSFSPNGRQETHKTSAKALLELRNNTMLVLGDIKINNITVDDALEKRNEIVNRYHEILKITKDAGNRAVNNAAKALKVNKDYTFDDDEIDSYLPVQLRKRG